MPFMARKDTKAEIVDSESAMDRADEGQGHPGPPKTVWREYFESAVVTAIMFMFFITFIARTVGVPTSSMQNTILIGDRFLINKFIFAPGSHPFFLPQRNVRRGDIVVFKYPGDRDHPGNDTINNVTPYKDYYIKRVIGLPNETIEVRGATVLINGQPLPECRVAAEQGENSKAPLDLQGASAQCNGNEPYKAYYSPTTLSIPTDVPEKADDTFRYAVGKPLVIPENHYFVMGDNRDNSADSRVWGLVSGDLMVGRALFVFWSYDESAPVSSFLVDFFRNSRWGRTGTMIK
jgi:signal peptidase I